MKSWSWCVVVLAGVVLLAGCNGQETFWGQPTITDAQKNVDAWRVKVDKTPQDWAARVELAKALYWRGVESEPQFNRQAVALLGDLQTEKPQDPLVMGYLGAARLWQAQDNSALSELLKVSREGLAALDQAVAAAPGNVELRFLRGWACRRLPGTFDRAGQSADDLAWVTGQVTPTTPATVLLPRFIAAAFYLHGLNLAAAGQLPQAQTMWNKAIATDPACNAAVAAQARLQRQAETVAESSADTTLAP